MIGELIEMPPLPYLPDAALTGAAPATAVPAGDDANDVSVHRRGGAALFTTEEERCRELLQAFFRQRRRSGGAAD